MVGWWTGSRRRPRSAGSVPDPEVAEITEEFIPSPDSFPQPTTSLLGHRGSGCGLEPHLQLHMPCLSFDDDRRISDILLLFLQGCFEYLEVRQILNKDRLTPLNTCALVAIGGTTRLSRTKNVLYMSAKSLIKKNLRQSRAFAVTRITRQTTRHGSSFDQAPHHASAAHPVSRCAKDLDERGEDSAG